MLYLCLALLLAPHGALAKPRLGGGSVKPSTTRPATASSSMPSSFGPKPSTTTGAAVAGGAGLGATAGALGGLKYSRPGYRSSGFIVPFAVGALAGGAAYSLSSNANAYCNGFSIQCYKAACAKSMSRCAGMSSETELVVATCPDSRFSECWQSPDTRFQCFGKRRPKYGTQDIVAYCNEPTGGGSLAYGNAAPASLPSKVLLAAAGLLPAALLL